MSRHPDRPKGVLKLVATPIGNLSDISERALDTLREADRILAEDTRRTAKLLTATGSGGHGRMTSYHDHNAASRLRELVAWLEQGLAVALVSDSGMPGVSDPAYRAVRAAIDGGFPVHVVPGASAVGAAVVASGLPTDRYAFEGFPPRRKGRRARRLEQMRSYPGSIVYFCGPHHILRFLGELLEAFGDREACVAREMTKRHEEYVRGTISGLISHFEARAPRGEITLVVAGSVD